MTLHIFMKDESLRHISFAAEHPRFDTLLTASCL